MTPEKKAEIKRLAEVLFVKRQALDVLGAGNIYGLEPSEAIKREQEYQVARGEYLEACAKLDAAQRNSSGPQ